MARTESTGQLNRLDLSKQIKLADLMREDYTPSGLNDPDYADRATDRLGFKVTAANVYNMRNSLGIASNQPKVRLREGPIEARVEALEAEVALLRAAVNNLVEKLGGV